jgi:hypothetical protein
MTPTNSAIPHPAVRIPSSVKVRKGNLLWERGDEWRTPTDRTVLAFSKLANAEDAQIAEFAARHGFLGMYHSSAKFLIGDEFQLPDGSLWATSETQGPSGSEPLLLWRMLARKVQAILRINTALNGRSERIDPWIGPIEDWRALDVEGPLESLEVNDAQFYLCNWVNWLLTLGRIRLELGITAWSRQQTDWKLEVSYSGLIGGVAYRLLLMVVGESRLYSCTGCAQPYIRLKRAPRPGQDNFCDDCQADGIPQQRATQRYRKGKPNE